jgi:hypothetical protein
LSNGLHEERPKSGEMSDISRIPLLYGKGILYYMTSVAD